MYVCDTDGTDAMLCGVDADTAGPTDGDLDERLRILFRRLSEIVKEDC